MKNDQQIIIGLSKVMNTLLSSNNMYFLHYRMQGFWGYQGLASRARESAMTASKNALQVMERILFLENRPNMVHCNEFKVGRTCEDQLNNQYKVEIDLSGLLRETIALCLQKKDYASKELLDKILLSNKKQINWLETQFSLLNDFGAQDYLSDQLEFQFRRADDLRHRNHSRALCTARLAG